MKQSQEINELAQALCVAQAEMLPVGKNAQGYGYKYATLDAVIDMARPILAQHGLAYVQLPGSGDPQMVTLTTRLMHESGQWIEESMAIPVPEVGKSNDAQAYGAALTYARRYALTAMLGIATDEDVDGAPQPKQAPRRKQQAPPPPRATSNGNGNGSPAGARSAGDVKAALIATAQDGSKRPASEGQLKYARASLSKLVDGDADRAKMILFHVYGLETSADLTGGQASALIDWVGSTADNDWTPVDAAQIEASRLIADFRKAQGQEPLFPEMSEEMREGARDVGAFGEVDWHK